MPKSLSFIKLYLASASPRRREILSQIGVDYDVLKVPSPPGEDEPQLPGELAHDYVCRTARDKAVRATTWVIDRQDGRCPSSGMDIYLDPARPILAADTTVILDDQVLGKPTDREDAKRILSTLSGRTHFVHTAVVLAWKGALWEDVSINEVRFAELSGSEIDAYCASDEPFGKAGAYGIQGKASVFVKHIAGSYTGIMGLPTHETYQLLVRAGCHT